MRLRIGSGFGIPIYLHWTFFLLPVWIYLNEPAEGRAGLPLGFTVLAFGFACVVLHEFGHALMARRFGIGTQDVTLYPIGGVARLERMTDKPLEEILIAVAGPAVNVVIAVAVFVALVPIAMMNSNLVLETFWGRVALSVLILNGLILVPFNMLPAFPMDGGRVLRALLAFWIGHYRATVVAVRVGLAMAILMSAAGIYYQHYMLAVIGFFVVFVGNQELLFARYREQQLRRGQDEEPLTVLPAPQAWRNGAARPASQPPVLLFQPKISVYTWDNQTGTWRQEPGTLT
jgi:Zn-dependent protease